MVAIRIFLEPSQKIGYPFTRLYDVEEIFGPNVVPTSPL